MAARSNGSWRRSEIFSDAVLYWHEPNCLVYPHRMRSGPTGRSWGSRSHLGPSALTKPPTRADPEKMADPNISAAASEQDRMTVSLARLGRQFPWVPRDTIASILGESYRLVVEASGRPLVDRAEELARIRLEIRTHRTAAVD